MEYLVVIASGTADPETICTICRMADVRLMVTTRNHETPPGEPRVLISPPGASGEFTVVARGSSAQVWQAPSLIAAANLIHMATGGRDLPPAIANATPGSIAGDPPCMLLGVLPTADEMDRMADAQEQRGGSDGGGGRSGRSGGPRPPYGRD